MKSFMNTDKGGWKKIYRHSISVLMARMVLISLPGMCSTMPAHPFMQHDYASQFFYECEKCAGKTDARGCCKKATDKKAHKKCGGDKLHRSDAAKGCCAAGKQETHSKCASSQSDASPAEKNPAPVEQ
jgi:hypothetical protein